MKKIISVVLLALLFAVLLNVVHAQDTNTTDDTNTIIDSNTIIDANHIDSDLHRFTGTTFSMKIRLTQLMDKVDLRIEQTQYVITKLDDLNDSNINTTVVASKLDDLIQIRNDINVTINSDENVDVLTSDFVTLKKASILKIAEIRAEFVGLIPDSLRKELKNEFKNERKDLKAEYRDMVKQYIKENNQQLRQRFNDAFKNFKENHPNLRPNDLNKSFKENLDLNIQRENINRDIYIKNNINKFQEKFNQDRNKFLNDNNRTGRGNGNRFNDNNEVDDHGNDDNQINDDNEIGGEGN